MLKNSERFATFYEHSFHIFGAVSPENKLAPIFVTVIPQLPTKSIIILNSVITVNT